MTFPKGTAMGTEERVVEAVAIGIAEWDSGHDVWPAMFEPQKNMFRGFARAAIAAYEKAKGEG